jgi:hypothetical protein
MKQSELSNLILEIKNYNLLSAKEKLLFDYELNTLFSSKGFSISIVQKIAKFSVNMNFSAFNENLHINEFIINDNQKIINKNPTLYDTILLDIFLYCIDIIHFINNTYKKNDLKLILKKEEAEHFILLKSLFDCVEEKNNQIVLILKNNENEYNKFFEISSESRRRMLQSLWTVQQDALCIREFLQRKNNSIICNNS